MPQTDAANSWQLQVCQQKSHDSLRGWLSTQLWTPSLYYTHWLIQTCTGWFERHPGLEWHLMLVGSNRGRKGHGERKVRKDWAAMSADSHAEKHSLALNTVWRNQLLNLMQRECPRYLTWQRKKCWAGGRHGLQGRKREWRDSWCPPHQQNWETRESSSGDKGVSIKGQQLE